MKISIIAAVARNGVIGREGAGVVEAIGTGVTGLKVGDRVAYGAAPIGSYAEARLIPADRLVKIPDNVSDQQAASIMLKGMTSQYLLRRTHPVVPGDIILTANPGYVLGRPSLDRVVLRRVASEAAATSAMRRRQTIRPRADHRAIQKGSIPLRAELPRQRPTCQAGFFRGSECRVCGDSKTGGIR